MFDVQGARLEGYTDEEIARYLAPKLKFDIDAALKEGYSATEITEYLHRRLTEQEAAKAAQAPPPPERRSPWKDILSGFAGAGELATKLAEMAVTFIPSGILQGIMSVAPPGTKVGNAAEFLQNIIAQYLTHQPQTEVGKKLAGAVEYPFKKFDEWGEAVADAIRENALAVGASPEAAATVATTIGGAIKFLPYAMGLRAGAKSYYQAKQPPIKKLPPPKEPIIEREIPIPPELERPALPPGQGFVLKPKTELRKAPAPKEPEIYVKKPDGTYAPGFYDEALGKYVTPIEEAAPNISALPPGQGFITQPPPPKTILRPRQPKGKAVVPEEGGPKPFVYGERPLGEYIYERSPSGGKLEIIEKELPSPFPEIPRGKFLVEEKPIKAPEIRPSVYDDAAISSLIAERKALDQQPKTQAVRARQNEIYNTLKEFYTEKAKEQYGSEYKALAQSDWDLIGGMTALDAIAFSHETAMRSLPGVVKRRAIDLEMLKRKESAKGLDKPPEAEVPREPLVRGTPTAEIKEADYSIVGRKEVDLSQIKTLSDLRRAFESGQLEYPNPSRYYQFLKEAEESGYKISRGKDKIIIRYGREWNPEKQEWTFKTETFQKPKRREAIQHEGIEFLGLPGQAKTKEIRARLNALTQADKDFQRNPVLRVEKTPDLGEVLVFTAKDAQTGAARRYRIKPEAISERLPELIKENKLQEGDYVRLSESFLKSGADEFYLAKRGTEGLVDVTLRAEKAELQRAAREARAKPKGATEQAAPSPGSLETLVKGGPGGTLPKYATGSAINLQRLKTTNDVLNFIDKFSESIEKKIGKRTVTWEETRRIAEEYGWDVEALKKAWHRRGAFKASQIEAARQVNLNAITDLYNALRELPYEKKEGYPPEIRAKILDAMDTVKITSQAASEAGRSLNIHKRILSYDPAFKQKAQMQRIIKLLTEKGKRVDQIIDALRNLPFDDPAAVNRAILNLTKTRWEKLTDLGFELLNVPRSIMASFDLSAPFRQGAFLIGYPREFFKAFREQFKYFASEKAYQKVMSEIKTRPTYPLMRKGGLALTELGDKLTLREERFMSGLAEKIPVVGRGIKASGRAYTGFLNKLRADVFDYFVSSAEKIGLEMEGKLLEDTCKFINSASGRGSIGGMQRSAQALNAFFFSPRLMASRLNLLNPKYYVDLNPFVRKQAIRSLLAFTGTGMTILTLARLGGATVNADPRNADFGKIKIGNTRIDPWGGFQSYIRLAAQLITGEHVSSTTNVKTTTGEGYKPLTRFDILLRFLETKEAPLASFITRLLHEKPFYGKEFEWDREIVERFVPMVIQDFIDLYNEGGAKELPWGLPAVFGHGVQTYSPGAEEMVYSANSVIKQAKELLQQGRRVEAVELVKRNKEILRIGKALEPIQKKINELRKQRRLVEEHVVPAKPLKKEAVEKIDQRIEQLKEKMEAEYKALVKKKK